jgi:hypothetical protein
MTVIEVPLRGEESVGTTGDEPLGPGSAVDVRNRFDGRWARGFEVVARDGVGYRVRRLSDGRELPSVFEPADIRLRERKRGSWWY